MKEARKKHDAQNAKPTLFDKLVDHVVTSLRGKRDYSSRTLIEVIAKVGSAPSAGGARAPLAAIMTHMGD